MEWWDGGKEEHDINSLVIGKVEGHDNIWILQIKQQLHYAQAKPFTDSLPLIVDEIKRIFHLTPTGTKKVVYNKKEYLLQRMKHYQLRDQNFLIIDVALNKLEEQQQKEVFKSYKEIIQYCYAFREIIGLFHNNNSVLKFRRLKKVKEGVIIGDTNGQIISGKETQIVTSSHVGQVLPQTVIKQWFDDINLVDVIVRLTNFNRQVQDLPERLQYYQNGIAKIINRIDRSYIWLVSHILKRLSHYLLLSIQEEQDRPWEPNEYHFNPYNKGKYYKWKKIIGSFIGF
jgi:hypothetical protein